MLRVVQCASAGAAKRYFVGGGGSPGDYYLQEEPGRWGGLGAERLGLVGEVGRDEFSRLCDNELPDGSGPLTERTNLNRRVGYDLNFHCPKSVSLLHAFSHDTAVLEAFRSAVDATMAMVEAEMKTRVRVAGQSCDRLTGNLLWATFVHTTSRPVDGVPDPHLHAHCLAFNATWDAVEGRWKAGQFGDLKRDASYFEACFHSLLATGLQRLGYEVERRGKAWEIAGVKDDVIGRFSRRTAVVEAEAKRRGITDPTEKAGLGAKTRRSKEESLPDAAVRARWRERVSDDELARILGRGNTSPLPSVTAKESVDFAVAAAFERSSVVSEKTLLAHALRRGVGCITPEEARTTLAERDLLRRPVDGQVLVSTHEVLREEQRMVAFARGGRSTAKPLGTKPKLSGTALNDGQRRAIDYLLTSTDRVLLVRGKAGTGKTTLMQDAVARVEDAGTPVRVFAPTTEARTVLRKEGFENAQTVARLLVDGSAQESVRHGVIWVDEAGLLGTKSLARVFDIAHEQSARVILSGDTGQHRSVERGDALRILERDAGLGGVTLRDIQRQRGEFKSAIESLAERRIDEGLRKLDLLGAVREAAPDCSHAELAAGYVAAVLAGKSALIVSPTHHEGGQVTEAVRARLTTDGRLGAERPIERLRSLGVTEAERTDPHLYKPGMVVEFHQNAKGFRAGSRYGVVAVDEGQVLVDMHGTRTPLPLESAARFDVFERDVLHVAEGDMVRVTRNGRIAAEGETVSGVRRLDNGSLHQFKRFTREGDLELANGWVVPKDFGHLAHGYCVTSHASQGKTVDCVFVAQSSDSFVASSAEQFYVSASRARERIVVYTDDRIALREAVSRGDSRLAATDLVRGRELLAQERESRPPDMSSRGDHDRVS